MRAIKQVNSWSTPF